MMYIKLTEIEKEILIKLVQGFCTKQIAKLRYRSPKTIDRQIECLYRKTGTNSRVRLCLWALKFGFITVDDAVTGGADLDFNKAE